MLLVYTFHDPSVTHIVLGNAKNKTSSFLPLAEELLAPLISDCTFKYNLFQGIPLKYSGEGRCQRMKLLALLPTHYILLQKRQLMTPTYSPLPGAQLSE